MFEEAVTEEAREVIKEISHFLVDFYLAGETGLALQVGHRRSYDLDFFTQKSFNPQIVLDQIRPERIHSIEKETLHCELRGVRLSFLYNELPLIFEPVEWNKIKVAHWLDITAEKFKTLSQRCSKKDFYEIYFAIKNSSIETVCSAFVKRFSKTGINIKKFEKFILQ